MGLFSRGDATARGQAEGERILRQAGVREERTARAMANRAGLEVGGAQHVAYEAPRSKRCLVVRADRVDLYDPDAEQAHRRVWRRDVREVLMEPGSGALAEVSVVGPDDTLVITVSRTQAVLLRDLLVDDGPPPAPPASSASSAASADTPLDVLRQLSAMRDEGLVTADEYDAKKAEILGRM